MPDSRRFTVEGRVQGVFFRDSTRRVAESLGITGHAINLPDGDVEVYACGEPGALDEFARWLAKGPPAAVVTRVQAREAEWTDCAGFRTG